MENITNTVVSNMNALRFSWYDYSLFALMLGISICIGIYFGCFGSRQKTHNEYLFGNKKMKVFPIVMSQIVSQLSGLILLAVPADVYRFGAGYSLLVVSLFFVALATNYIFLPVFFKLELTSIYEYLEKRFDYKCRKFGSFIFIFTMLLYLPIVIYIPALAFSAASGINIHFITPLVCIVCIFYTAIGGIKALVWTDTYQFTLTLTALTVIFVYGIKSGGGIEMIFVKSYEGERLNVFDFDLDPTKRDTFWQCTIGLFFLWMSVTAVNQGSVQKLLTLSSLKEAQLSIIYFSVGLSLVTLICCFTGLIMYSKYSDCDPFTAGIVQKNDQLLVYYIMDVVGHIPGLPGLFMAGIFCASLSTLASRLNSLAGSTYKDFISVYISDKRKKQAGSLVLKLLVIFFGAICTALVFLIERFGGLLPLTTSIGLTYGPLLALFTLGMLFPKVNHKGAFYGCVLGLIFSLFLVSIAQYYKMNGAITYPPKPTSISGCDIYNSSSLILSNENVTGLYKSTAQNLKQFTPFILFRISYYYYIVLGFLVSIFCSILISCFTMTKNYSVDRDLLSPVIYFLLPKEKQYDSVEKALKITNNF